MLLALAFDLLFGEPPEALHPVVWMGRGLAWLETHAPGFASRTPVGPNAHVPCVARRRPWVSPSCASAAARFASGRLILLNAQASCSARARLAFGAVVGLGHPVAWGLVGWAIGRFSPWPLQALALKPTFAGRALLQAAARVEAALRADQPAEARQALVSLVSRPTAELSPSLVAAAAIESLAENLVDSWVAPLLAYALCGLPGAYAYRAANTADAMWGYRTPSYEHLGKTAARLDDALTFVPARVGALLLVLAGPRPRQALTVWRRDAHRTPSPNAGQPMSAIAGQLGVRLEKPGAYVLNKPAPEPSCEHIGVARRLVARAMLLACLLELVGLAARARQTPRRARTADRPTRGCWSRRVADLLPRLTPAWWVPPRG